MVPERESDECADTGAALIAVLQIVFPGGKALSSSVTEQSRKSKAASPASCDINGCAACAACAS